MAKPPKVLPAETVPAEAPEASKDASGATEATPPVPQGNPLDWTVAEWLAAANFPLDKVRADLAAQAGRSGAAGIPFQFALSLVQNHANPAVLAEAFGLVALGLVKVVSTGSGPSGHSGSDLVG